MKPIYLDYAATTPVDPRVIEKMHECLGIDGVFGNPSSDTHRYGKQANQLVEAARAQVAKAINAEPREIVWTSGATEADNLAITGLAEFYQHRSKHIITAKTEHKAVLDTCKALEKRGFTVTYLSPQKSGEIALADIAAAITPDTLLVSLMLVNNESGYVQDIAAIGKLVKEKNCFFHVDAAQASGKTAIDVQAMQVDLLSLSAHKVYGPKGIGALYVRHKPPVKLHEQIHGGGHEHGMRSGTLATHQIVGMGTAYEIANKESQADNNRIEKLRTELLTGLQQLSGIHINTDLNHSVPHILNVSFEHTDINQLLAAISDDIAISTGSACNSVSIEPSHVLLAMGVDSKLARNTVRFSLGRFTTEEDIKKTIEVIVTQVNKSRGEK